MQFLYVFLLMFFSIFGLAALLKLLADALLRSSFRPYDVYVRCDDDDIEEFVNFARKSCHIGSINLILSEGEYEKQDETAIALAGKYADVHIIGKQQSGDFIGK